MFAVRLKDELLGRGYVYSELLLDRKYKQYSLPNGQLVLTKSSYYEYPFITQTARRVSKDKMLSYAFAKSHGIVVPATLQTADYQAARQFLSRYKRIIIKPAEMGGGRGLTMNIVADEQLQQALTLATYQAVPPLIQEQFMGEEVRLTVLGGVVKSVILRQAPQIVGDGRHTIANLIEQENAQRRTLSFPLLTYPQLNEAIIDPSFLSDHTVPAVGEVVQLSSASMIKKGASFYGITDDIHPSYIAMAEKLALHLNPAMLVVDFLVKDYRQAAGVDNYVFLEFNTAPALEIYSSLRGGDTPPVMSYLADLVDGYAQLYAPKG